MIRWDFLRGVDPQPLRGRSRFQAVPPRLWSRSVPTLTVMAGSMAPLLPIVALWPELPPIGYLLLLGWRLLRTDVWPVWAGVPLGLFDDVFSGQPLGSGMALWTLTLMAMEVLDRRYIFRTMWRDWLVVAAFLFAYIGAMLLAADWTLAPTSPLLLLPQFLFSVLIYPMVARICLWCDARRWGR